mgnify:FL=1|jgi:uncharacterized alkaline shock family protein YloU
MYICDFKNLSISHCEYSLPALSAGKNFYERITGMNTKDKECKGSLKVSEDVISKIAATAASETEGAFCGEDNVFVRYSGGAAEINIELSLKEGVRAVCCAESVQEAVRNGVQNMTGITVSRVNVKICGQV